MEVCKLVCKACQQLFEAWAHGPCYDSASALKGQRYSEHRQLLLDMARYSEHRQLLLDMPSVEIGTSAEAGRKAVGF